MTEIVLKRRMSHKAANRELSRAIRMDKWWISKLEKATGKKVYPRPHEVYRVERDGKRFCLVFDDPSL